MKRELVFFNILLAALWNFSLFADATVCKSGKVERRIEVTYSDPAQKVPCEVKYYKETDESQQGKVLWSAQNESGYCETKATEFAEKLKTMGWDCLGDLTATPSSTGAASENTETSVGAKSND